MIIKSFNEKYNVFQYFILTLTQLSENIMQMSFVKVRNSLEAI